MSDVENSVNETIDLFFDGYARGDIAACLSAFAVQQPVMVVGTNIDEICQNREQLELALKRDFACMSAVHWGAPRHRQVVASPAMASVFIERPLSYTADGQEQQVLFRYAFTLLPESGQWKICSAMAAVPAAAGNYQFE